MIAIKNLEWWHPDYQFFGPQFYLKGDNSVEGINPALPLSLSERTAREVAYIINYLQPKPGDHILDCPCGYGRHLIALAAKGLKLTGIDMNEDFIKIGKSNALSEGLNGQASFLNQNMLDLQVAENSFDHVINMFSSFGFFEHDIDNERVVQSFFNTLKTGGKLMLHFDFNATRVINKSYFKGDENRYRKCSYNGKDYDLYIDEHYDKKQKRLKGSWTLRGDNHPVTKFYSIRIYQHIELQHLLLNAGFTNVQFYDPDNAAFTSESKETIIVATK